MRFVQEFGFYFIEVIRNLFSEIEFFCNDFSIFSKGMLQIEILCFALFSFDYSHKLFYHYKPYKYFILAQYVMVMLSLCSISWYGAGLLSLWSKRPRGFKSHITRHFSFKVIVAVIFFCGNYAHIIVRNYWIPPTTRRLNYTRIFCNNRI